MEPTAVALALEGPVRQAVEALRGALGAVRAFDPAEAVGVVRIAALDAEQAALVPPLAARLRQAAPGLRLSVLPLGRGEALAALAEGGPTLRWATSGTCPTGCCQSRCMRKGSWSRGRLRCCPMPRP